MSNVIRYTFLSCVVNNGTEEKPVNEPIFLEKCMPYSKTNEEIAKHEAYNGEYTIEDDGKPDPEDTPTKLDRVEAQATYTAMMTDTLLEV